MTTPSTTTRTLSWLAASVALAITILPPLGFFLMQREGLVRSLESDARVQAIMVSNVVGRNPQVWIDANERLLEAVEPVRHANRSTLILDRKHQPVGEIDADLGWPLIEREDTFFDSGTPAGIVRVAASLGAILAQTALVLTFSGALGFIVYVPLRRMPVNALRRAAESLVRAELNRSLVDGLSEGVILTNARLEVIAANRSAENFPGLAQPIVNGAQLADCLAGAHNADGTPLAIADWPMQRCLESGQPEGPVVMCLGPAEGRQIYLSVRAQPIRHGEQNEHPAVVTSIEDITQQQLAANRLVLTERAFQSSRDAILITDHNLRIVSANDAFTALTGYTMGDILGQKPSVLHSGRQSNEFYAAMWASINSSGAWSGEIWNRRKNRDIFPAWLSISEVRDPAGRVTHYLGTAFDITERREAEERMRHLAQHDALTGLPNRTYLRETLAHAVAAARRHGWRVGVYFIDLDHFKLINDTMGHRIGDLVLGEVARRLGHTLREEDSIGRLAGDEFVAIIPTVDSDAALVTIAENILEVLSEPFELEGHEFFLTCSVGIVVFPDDGADVDALLSNADTAMYAAKTDGRANFKFFAAAMNETGHNQLETSHAVRVGLEQNQFELYYQPQVEADDPGRIVGAEALIRWNHPTDGLILPGRFVPVIEGSRLIIEMGDWVLDQALQQARAWRAQGIDACISVNVSPLHFRQPTFVADLEKAAARHSMVPDSIRIEVTEGLMLTDPETTIEKMHQIRALGYRLSLDDFGTGYSSLAYLARFPFDELKIDRSFVCRAPKDKTSLAIIDAVISLAHALGLSVVAEGVEIEAEAETLRQLGCNHIQGYLYGKPVPAAAFTRRLLEAAADAELTGTPGRP